jgi:hypothetical protein
VSIREVAELLSLVVGDPYWRLILHGRLHSLDEVVLLLQLLDFLDLLQILLLLQLRESSVDQLSVHLRVR